MSRPITVVKEKQIKPRSSFAFVYLCSQSLPRGLTAYIWPIKKQQWKIMGPVSETRSLIDNSYLIYIVLKKIPFLSLFQV